MKNNRGFINILIIGIVAVAIAGIAGYVILQKTDNNTEPQEKTSVKGQLETVKQRSIEAGLIRNINQLQMSLSFYFDQNGVLPSSLSELYPQFISDKKIVENKNYLYAYPKDRKTLTYHLGIKLQADVENQPALKNDDDFNSISARYVNGFNGADPVYDIAVSKSLIQATPERGDNRDRIRVGIIRSLVTAIEIYQDSNSGIPPASVNLLESIVSPDALKELQGSDYFYAVSRDKKSFHVGAKLKSPNNPLLQKDDDFDSSTAGYTNGFSGKDPIYDKAY